MHVYVHQCKVRLHGQEVLPVDCLLRKGLKVKVASTQQRICSVLQSPDQG